MATSKVDNVFDLSEYVLKSWMLNYAGLSYKDLFGADYPEVKHSAGLTAEEKDGQELFMYLKLVDLDKVEEIEAADVLNDHLDHCAAFQTSIMVVFDFIMKSLEESCRAIFSDIFFIADKEKHIFIPYKLSEDEKKCLYDIHVKHGGKPTIEITELLESYKQAAIKAPKFKQVIQISYYRMSAYDETYVKDAINSHERVIIPHSPQTYKQPYITHPKINWDIDLDE